MDDAISVIKKDNSFWKSVKTLRLKIRFVNGTAATIWTKGSFVTGDFYDRIYFLEVKRKDTIALKGYLEKEEIKYTEGKINNKRPLIWIIQKEDFEVGWLGGLPVMPLKELVEWARKLNLENILEHLDILYKLGLNIKYSEVLKNV